MSTLSKPSLSGEEWIHKNAVIAFSQAGSWGRLHCSVLNERKCPTIRFLVSLIPSEERSYFPKIQISMCRTVIAGRLKGSIHIQIIFEWPSVPLLAFVTGIKRQVELWLVIDYELE